MYFFIFYRHKINQLSHDENAEVHAGNLEALAAEKEDFGGLLQQNENEEVITITSFLASQPASSKQLPNSFEFNLIEALDSHLLTSNSKEVQYTHSAEKREIDSHQKKNFVKLT